MSFCSVSSQRIKSLLGSLMLAAVSLPFTLAAQTAPVTPAPAAPATAPAAKAAPVAARPTAAKHKAATRRHHKAIRTTKPAAEKKAA
jgi:hypothetical protein